MEIEIIQNKNYKSPIVIKHWDDFFDYFPDLNNVNWKEFEFYDSFNRKDYWAIKYDEDLIKLIDTL